MKLLFSITSFLTRGVATSLVTALFILTATSLRADGHFIPWNRSRDINEPSQKAAIYCKDGVETMVLQVKYEGQAEDFAWVAPLPHEPQVTALPESESPFEELGRLSRAQDLALGNFKHSKNDEGGDEEVVVKQRKAIGVYDIAVLGAKSGKSLSDWLNQRGFKIPEGNQGVLDDYIRRGWIFTAIRIRPGKSGAVVAADLHKGELQPVCFKFMTYPSPWPIYPLKISSLNSGNTELLLYLLADRPLVLKDNPGWDGFAPTHLVAPGTDDPYGVNNRVEMKLLTVSAVALGLPLEPSMYVCKYRQTLSPEEMSQDLFFEPFDQASYWKQALAKSRLAGDEHARIMALNSMSRFDPEASRELAHERNPEGRRIFVRRLPPKVPGDVLITLAKDPDTEVREILAGYYAAEAMRWAPVEAILALARDLDVKVRREMARNCKLPAALELLAWDKDPEARRIALHRASPSPRITEAILRYGDGELKMKLAMDHDSTVSILKTLALETDEGLLSQVAWNNNSTDEVFERIFPKGGAWTRGVIAGKTHSCHILEQYGSDPDKQVRQTVAGNPSTPVAVLKEMAKDGDHEILVALAKNPATPRNVLIELAGLKGTNINFSVCERWDKAKDLDKSWVGKLDASIRDFWAHETKEPAVLDLLIRLSPEPGVRERVAANTRAMPALLESLAAEDNSKVRAAVAANPSTPGPTLDKLIKDSDLQVRMSVGKNESLSELQMETILHSGDPLQELALNSKIPVKMLRQMVELPGNGAFWISLNANAPDDLLQQLTKNPDAKVRDQAVQALKRREKTKDGEK